MRDVLHHAVHRPTKQVVLLVVHRHDDEQLRSPRRLVEHLAQSEPIVHEVVRVACRGTIPHVRELALGAVRAAVEQLLRDWRVEDEVTMEELDTLHRFVPSRDALRDAPIANVVRLIIVTVFKGQGRIIVRVRTSEPTREWRASASVRVSS